MKRILATILSVLMVLVACFGIASCGNQCDHVGGADGEFVSYNRTTATCSQGGIEYYNCSRCGQEDAIEKTVEAYSHSYEIQLDDGSNVKCLYCDKTQVTVSASNELPKTVTTKTSRYASKVAKEANRMSIKSVDFGVDIVYHVVSVIFNCEVTEVLMEETPEFSLAVSFLVKDKDGNAVGDTYLAKNSNQKRDIEVGYEISLYGSIQFDPELTETYDYTIEILDVAIIDNVTGGELVWDEDCYK